MRYAHLLWGQTANAQRHRQSYGVLILLIGVLRYVPAHGIAIASKIQVVQKTPAEKLQAMHYA